MQKLLKIFGMLLITSLSGCQSSPFIVKQNFLYLEIRRDPDGKVSIDSDLSFCREREYKFSRKFVGPREKFRDIPLEECRQLVGYGPSEYAQVVNFQEDVRQAAEDHDHE